MIILFFSFSVITYSCFSNIIIIIIAVKFNIVITTVVMNIFSFFLYYYSLISHYDYYRWWCWYSWTWTRLIPLQPLIKYIIFFRLMSWC